MSYGHISSYIFDCPSLSSVTHQCIFYEKRNLTRLIFPLFHLAYNKMLRHAVTVFFLPVQVVWLWTGSTIFCSGQTRAHLVLKFLTWTGSIGASSSGVTRRNLAPLSPTLAQGRAHSQQQHLPCVVIIPPPQNVWGLYWIRFVASVRPSVSNSCPLYNSFTNERISFKLE